ncbi:double-strand break repair helicase AddA [Sedimentitalea nanhaiensis]|uniref:DNA 3'-5' helicase n=1 Tax=Sedimentitalea nanhaiensis TaxID=999627 RepID=A0A1I7CB83_9RHOB|nr:double-strand break repair helicase AddA [Sedimentitalea nanhaiensis]SFT96654.1 DNA helicase/exodeoxyribonuclease V, subunit A [Sedimentitalea nanhaiensis]
MSPRDEATRQQVRAARPDASTWLAANAGSGKTRVLTDRVARLLLDGIHPEHILCLTYTKAAASEMQNRLFRRLGDWAMLDDTRLSEALNELGSDTAPDVDRLSHARTLFARAIETPGGLKIQTIHSFCAALLRRFPLEAGVSPQFAEMEDRAAELLQAEIVEDMAEGPHAYLVDAVAKYISDTGFGALTSALVHRRDAFQAHSHPDLHQALGLPDDFDDSALAQQVFLGSETDLLARLVAALKTGSTMDLKNAAKLAAIAAPTVSDLPILEGVFLTGAGAKAPFTAKLGSFPTKAVQNAHADLMPEVEDLMRRVEAARALRLGVNALHKTRALHNFAATFLPEYARRKQLRGWLDFDDLILKARQLLNDPAVAGWVLYRLDGSIDHILVDEAQDTSPVQWDVVEKLAQEFTSGLGARDNTRRTLFVVGDKKQSIYSFQGADPAAFDRMQAEFGRRLADTANGLQDLSLEFSFRSSDAILRLVDLVFVGRSDAGFPATGRHRAFKTDLPGRVDLWPAVDRVADEEDREWTDPVDRPSPEHHNVVLANRIATTIKCMIDDGETIPIDGDTPGQIFRRPVCPGDFLILVQRRSDLFAEIIRACKSAGLAVAGADRLKVGAELAVKDLAALLGFLATPEDSLALATILKSPLFGWNEQELFDLAHRRTGRFLWPALRDRASEFPETMRILDDLRGQTDFLRPYDLIERILTRHGGRRKLLSRLGPEAEDGINALLSQALAYERTDIPSLTGFLVWIETDDLEIKRQMGSAGDMVRVMTVHGAKGLESPIVILPDTGPRKPPQPGEIMMVGDLPMWRVNTDQMPESMAAARDGARQAQMNERLRLLYVALTRAEKWLIVATAGDLDRNGDSWYQMVQAGLVLADAAPHAFHGGPGLRLDHGDWTAPPLRLASTLAQQRVPAPGFIHRPAPPPVRAVETLSPSVDLGGAKALPGDAGLEEQAAKLRGTRIHLLLEHLPLLTPADWPDAVVRLLPDLPASDRTLLLDEAAAVLTAPDLKDLFTTEALVEVPLTAEIHGLRMHGVIDRLIVAPGRIRAIDFKSNMTVPENVRTCPDGLLRQMGAYAAMLDRIYPGQHIETEILWTRTATLMVLPHDLVTNALFRAPRLDGTDMGS